MPISASELETAGATFGAALVGYIADAGFVVSNASLEHGAIVGAIAAFAALGYHVVAGNVTTSAPASPPATP